MLNQHYTTKEIAEKLGVSVVTVIQMFSQEPGVFFLGGINKTRRTRNEIRIPEDVLERVYKRRVR